MAEFEEFLEAAKSGDINTTEKVLDEHPELVNQKDETGATALHFAAFSGHRELARVLVKHGADINAPDDRFGATATGWAIEYLREMGGFLSIELQDFAYAIEKGDIDWVRRFLERFPGLAHSEHLNGKPFKVLAMEVGHPEILKLFE